MTPLFANPHGPRLGRRNEDNTEPEPEPEPAKFAAEPPRRRPWFRRRGA